MKALKTIVATAVIVFALTTVAMAGAGQISSRDRATTPAAIPAATQTHQGAGMTLTDGQFARLLRAVNGQVAKLHSTQADREMSRDRARDRQAQKAGDSAIHAPAEKRTQTHDVGGAHDGGTHHDGGACDE